MSPERELVLPATEESFQEIDTLYAAFASLSGKLGASLKELLQLKDQEALTRLLALQSQMNPHFLYNNLTNISALAEEKKNKEVVSMCQDLSFMLRYTAEKDPKGASIKEEMDYVRKYLTCMKLRYEEDLEFTLSYPDSLAGVRIPRILIQPLVENSINHGFHTVPPLKIRVEGWIEGDLWTIVVSDNGAGFSQDILDKFQNIHYSDDGTEHIGLNNTRQRIKLIYGKNGLFNLQNHADGGAVVTIQGDTHYRESSI